MIILFENTGSIRNTNKMIIGLYCWVLSRQQGLRPQVYPKGPGHQRQGRLSHCPRKEATGRDFPSIHLQPQVLISRWNYNVYDLGLHVWRWPSIPHQKPQVVRGSTLRLELRGKNDLRHYIQDESKIVIAEVACALEYLHARNIVHRDMKPDVRFSHEFSDAAV